MKFKLGIVLMFTAALLFGSVGFYQAAKPEALAAANCCTGPTTFVYSTFYNDATTPWAVQWKDGSQTRQGTLPAGRWVDPVATGYDARWVYNPTGRCIILLRRSTPGYGPDRWIDTGHYSFAGWIFLADYAGEGFGGPGSGPTSWLVIGRKTSSCA